MDPSSKCSARRIFPPARPLLLLRLLHPQRPLVHDLANLPVDLGPRLRIKARQARGIPRVVESFQAVIADREEQRAERMRLPDDTVMRPIRPVGRAAVNPYHRILVNPYRWPHVKSALVRTCHGLGFRASPEELSLTCTFRDEHLAPPLVVQDARLEADLAQQAHPLGAWKNSLDVRVVHDPRVAIPIAQQYREVGSIGCVCRVGIYCPH
jgi:hypothetical protein